MRTFHFTTALLPEGWADDVVIAVEDGLIADFSVGAPCPPFTDRLPGIAVAGLANLHSHVHQRAIAGLTQRAGDDEDGFWTWRRAMYAALERLTPEDLQEIATQAFVEMLQGGYTRVAEFHYLHHQADGSPYADPAEMGRRIEQAAAAAGIGLTLLPVLYAAGGFGGVPPEAGQRRFACDLDRFLRLREAGGWVGAAPHSLRAVPPETLDQLIAATPRGPIHIHIAEQQREVAECLAYTGQRPIAWLLDHAEVDGRWCLVHATHAGPTEVGGMAASGAVVGLCPTTEADLGDGIFPAADFQRAGGRIGVGSDSQVAASPFEELRLLEWGQRLTTGRRAVLAGGVGRSTGRSLLDWAQQGGAAACGKAGGRLAIGMPADITVLAPLGQGDDALDLAIFAPRSNPVRHVVAGGECVVRDGRHRLQTIAAERFARVVARLAA